MFYFNPFNCFLKNLDTEHLSHQPPIGCLQYLHPPVTPLPSLSPFFIFDFLSSPLWNDFSATFPRKSNTLSRVQWDTLPLRQVGQPNWAMRQDIHHYVIGWSKWPWCSLHTQFQIPLGSIMGRFKQEKRGWPSHLILMIMDVISVRCSEREKEQYRRHRRRGG